MSDANVVLNTIVAESLRQFADELETAEDFRKTLHDLIVRTIHDHKRIIFNGNNYSAEWVEEAARRGLLNLPSTVDALPAIPPKRTSVFLKPTGCFPKQSSAHAGTSAWIPMRK